MSSTHSYYTRSKCRASGLDTQFGLHCSRSNAAYMRPDSTSSNSKTPIYNISSEMIKWSELTATIGTEKELYNLDEVIEHLGLNQQYLISEIQREHSSPDVKLINDHLTGKLLASICSDLSLDCITVIDKEIHGMSLLHPLYSSTHIRPDVLVRHCDGVKLVVGITGEVLSSPMRETERKAMSVAINLLRLARCSQEDCSSVCVFVFPKLGTN